MGVVSGRHAPITTEEAEEIVGVRLSCTNLDLLSGLEAYWATPPREEDGSDTRSLAYHVSIIPLSCDLIIQGPPICPPICQKKSVLVY